VVVVQGLEGEQIGEHVTDLSSETKLVFNSFYSNFVGVSSRGQDVFGLQDTLIAPGLQGVFLVHGGHIQEFCFTLPTF